MMWLMSLLVLGATATILVLTVNSLRSPARRGWVRVRAWFYRKTDPSAAVMRASIEEGVQVVLRRLRNGLPPPTLIEFATASRDYTVLRGSEHLIEEGIAENATPGGQVWSLRVQLREMDHVRRGRVLVLAVDDSDPTVRFGEPGGMVHPSALARAILILDKAEHVITTRTTLGRGADNKIVLASDRASSNHATIDLIAGEWRICDHSSNGTWLDGRRLAHDVPTALPDRAAIRFADINGEFGARA